VDPHCHWREEGDAEEREREDTLRREPVASSRGAMGERVRWRRGRGAPPTRGHF